MRTVRQTLQWSLMPVLLLVLAATTQPAQGQCPGSVMFDNQTGEFALVILVGPTSRSVTVPAGWTRTVRVAEGAYYILVRYGLSPKKYRYVRGEVFAVPATGSTSPPIQITLFRVAPGGDCIARTITPEEFQSALNLQVRTASN